MEPVVELFNFIIGVVIGFSSYVAMWRYAHNEPILG